MVMWPQPSSTDWANVLRQVPYTSSMVTKTMLRIVLKLGSKNNVFAVSQSSRLIHGLHEIHGFCFSDIYLYCNRQYRHMGTVHTSVLRNVIARTGHGLWQQEWLHSLQNKENIHFKCPAHVHTQCRKSTLSLILGLNMNIRTFLQTCGKH